MEPRPTQRRRTAVAMATAAMAAGLLIGLGGLATATAAGADTMKPAIAGGSSAMATGPRRGVHIDHARLSIGARSGGIRPVGRGAALHHQ